MISQSEIENKLRNLKPTLSSMYYVERIGYSGSFARNEQKDTSDIDIIVDLKKPLGWEFFDLKEFLEKELNIKVDLVSIKAIKEQLKKTILQQVVYI